MDKSVESRDPEALDKLGQLMHARFLTYEQDRRLAELRMLKNARQFLGILDPELEAMVPKTRSRAYPKLTRVKVMSMVARLMNLLFPATEQNWDLEPSPVPSLAPDDLQAVIDQAVQEDPELPLKTPDEVTATINAAIREFARRRAGRLRDEILDQLAELGGSKDLSYVALCKQVVLSAVKYGCGVLSGPFAVSRTKRSWRFDQATRKVEVSEEEVFRPQFQFVPIWDYYPDMSAKTFRSMDGQFERMVLSRAEVRALADRPDFFGDVIRTYLAEHQQGNYMRRQYEIELKSLGVANYVQDQTGRKYELLKWSGYLYGKDFRAAGMLVPDDDPQFDAQQYEGELWLLDGVVIKIDMSAWAEADVPYRVQTYHQFVFEDDDTSLLGNALPNIMRDSQMGVTAASMLLMDNASSACAPSVEVNKALLSVNQDLNGLYGGMVIERDETDPQLASIPAVRELRFDAHVTELLEIVRQFHEFADIETFIGPASGGDMQKGPSEPFRSAAGAAMLKNDAALPFKDVVRNFDIFTGSLITSLVAFNYKFGDPELRGDFQVVARGSTALVAKEIRGIAIDQMTTTLTDEERMYIKPYYLLRERFATRELPKEALVSEEEAKRIDDRTAQARSQAQDDQRNLVMAEIRGMLADAMKAVTQAQKNSAAAAAETANVALEALQHGLDREVAEQDKDAGASGKPAKAQK